MFVLMYGMYVMLNNLSILLTWPLIWENVDFSKPHQETVRAAGNDFVKREHFREAPTPRPPVLLSHIQIQCLRTGYYNRNPKSDTYSL